MNRMCKRSKGTGPGKKEGVEYSRVEEGGRRSRGVLPKEIKGLVRCDKGGVPETDTTRHTDGMTRGTNR